MNVTIYLNTSTDEHGRSLGRMDGYQPTHTLTKAYQMVADPFGTTDLDVLRVVFDVFNVGDDPDFFNPPSPHAIEYRKAGNRSLSVGDVVVLDGRAYACARFGWDTIELSGTR